MRAGTRVAGPLNARGARAARELAGIGMTSPRTRLRMVERLRRKGIRDERVLAAMAAVPRHLFVDEALASRAYEDTALPIGFSHITDLRTTVRPTREEVILRYLAAESFMTFVVDHYGRDRVPDLLLGLVRYGAWEDIIPTVFGDSVSEFLDAWNAHLVHEYGLDDRVLE